MINEDDSSRGSDSAGLSERPVISERRREGWRSTRARKEERKEEKKVCSNRLRKYGLHHYLENNTQSTAKHSCKRMRTNASGNIFLKEKREEEEA